VTLSVLVKREVKAFLKNPAFIFSLVLIVVMYSILFGIMRVGIEQAATEAARVNIGVVVTNHTQLLSELLWTLNATTGGRVRIYNTLADAVQGEGVGILFPSNLDQLVESGVVELRGSVKVLSMGAMSAQSRLMVLESARSLIEQLLPEVYSKVYNTTPPLSVKVRVSSSVVYYEREMSSQSFIFISNIVSFIPILIGIIIGSNAGYATQLVAFEKVEKAFEMLLSQPIKRSKIVLAKIIGASIASIIFAAAYFGGLLLPLVIMPLAPETSSGAGIESSPLQATLEGLDINPITGIVLPTILALLLGLLASGSLGILLGSLVSDERTAGILITPVMMIYMGLSFAALFLGFELNYLMAVISGILVVTLPSLYVASILANKTALAMVSMSSAVLTCIILVLISIVVFNKDIVVLGVRVRFKRGE
jgi:ABC-2 type transport system permease protein